MVFVALQGAMDNPSPVDCIADRCVVLFSRRVS
jgi:hypothetical protein